MIHTKQSRNWGLFFIHGAGGRALHWGYQTRFFRKLGYNVVAIDLPGHGATPVASLSSIEDYAEYVERIASLPTNPFVLVGHSMGAAIALTLATRDLSGCRGLVLFGAGAKLRVRQDIIEALRTDARRAAEVIVASAYGDVGARQRGAALRQLRSVPSEVLLREFLACDAFDIRERLSAVSVPVLLVVGGLDALTPVRYAEYLAERLPHAELSVLSSAGHMAMIERPVETSVLVREFVERLK